MIHSFNAAPRGERGYTIMELVVSTALLAVLIQLAIPQLGQLLSGWQRDQVTRAMTNHLMLARSEAIRWSQRVVMCSSRDGLQCTNSSDKEWKSGWLVFQDIDNNGQFNDTDKLIAVSGIQEQVRDIRGNALIQRFVFMPTGMMAAGMGTIEIIPHEGETQKITVNRIGRIRISSGSVPRPA